MLLPAFHPPCRQARSRSMAVPFLKRRLAHSLPPPPKQLLKAIRLREVGTTQLVVPGVQGQPNWSGSNRTFWSVVRYLHFHNQCASRPRLLSSHDRPFSVGFSRTENFLRVITAREVTQEPSESSPTKAGQLPFPFCVFSKNRIPLEQAAHE